MIESPIVVTKKTLAQNYGVTPKVIRYYLNVHFFDELELVGYSKKMRILSPKVVRRFTELYGEPLKTQNT